MSVERFLLIAGEGGIPALVYRQAIRRGHTVKVASFSFFKTDPDLPRDHVMEFFSLDVLFAILERFDYSHLCLSGKVPRGTLLESARLGEDLLQSLKRCEDWRDGPLLTALFERIRQAGYHLLSPLDFLQEFLTRPEIIVGPGPTPEEWEDIRFGFSLARFLADWEVGQTVVLKRKAVLSVEAAEGTNEAIRRGVALTRGRVVVIKAARSYQDGMVDFPTAGPETVRLLGESGGGVLALEAGKTLIPDLATVIKLAGEGRVSVLGVAGKDEM
ncbi:MAG TPA: UDP-2,3-diacylglucosamine diphosphatase LpxI [Atribacteraceae bacterium]|nr:UDP-2,3-diacylglucosamine diphosphatase LpxI [Atribacteraceae bacterium]